MPKRTHIRASRREFLRESLTLGAATLFTAVLNAPLSAGTDASGPDWKLGLCTYLWGQDWDLPTLIANCEKSRVMGVELRTTHRHGVEPSLGPQERSEVRKRFADSPITLVGLGSNEAFDSPDPDQLKRSIEAAKGFLRLSHDCGGSGVKVKPNDFHDGAAHEQTIEQIGRSLNTLGRLAADLGQQVRLEVHGQCRELPTIKQIMDVADHPSVAVCWNCNADKDLAVPGLAYNFGLVAHRLGATCHVHELDSDTYPYREFFGLLAKARYVGWLLLECSERSRMPKDGVAAMAQQQRLFEAIVAGLTTG
jgi:sugar phosphate isomerase/epimerase